MEVPGNGFMLVSDEAEPNSAIVRRKVIRRVGVDSETLVVPY
jgi:hypothetical protein